MSPGPWEVTRHPYRSCERKIAYDSRATARDAASRLARDTGDKFCAYKCPYCEYWHVGHRKGKG